MIDLTTNKTKNVGISSFFQGTLFDQSALTLFRILIAPCLIAISAQIKIPLYFTPVPLTLQTAAVMLVGAVLGSRKGMLAVMLYLVQGSMGLPVWAGGLAGFVHLAGPTGGYMMAFILQAYLVGKFLEEQPNASLIKIMGVLLFSTVLQLGMGTLWLAQFVGLQHCFMCGFQPFILGEIAKACILSFYLASRKNN